MSDVIRLEPNPENKCFGCGGDNPGGMKLTFEQDNVNRRIVGKFILGERYQGGGGFAHGGIIAMLLDEIQTDIIERKVHGWFLPIVAAYGVYLFGEIAIWGRLPRFIDRH